MVVKLFNSRSLKNILSTTKSSGWNELWLILKLTRYIFCFGVEIHVLLQRNGTSLVCIFSQKKELFKSNFVYEVNIQTSKSVLVFI